MIKKAFILLILIVFTSRSAYCLDTTLFEVRNKIFEESKEIKLLLKDSPKDAIFANSLWDTCVISITQLDAYFSMLGILNTVKEESLNNVSIKYLERWLNDMKETNGSNIASLNDISKASNQQLKMHMLRLADFFAELNVMIEIELSKIKSLRDSLNLIKKSLEQ